MASLVTTTRPLSGLGSIGLAWEELIPYRWEQIGSKRVTSSKTQRRSEVDQLDATTGHAIREHRSIR
jgi:hypothetical protein